MMYLSNFPKFPTFIMCGNQLIIPTKNKQNGANDSQLKLTIRDV